MKTIILIVSILANSLVTNTNVPNEKITYGSLRSVYEDGALFISYDDEVWWYLECDEFAETPQLNSTYKITYDTNGTDSCEHTDCDNCWRADDTLKKIEKIF